MVASTSERASEFLRERLTAVDGMAVTAEVWNAAHDYHRQMQEAHTRYTHGAGVITGLQVKATEPVEARQVHVQQGVAVDPYGRIIIYPQPSAIDLGDQTGTIYIVLYTPGESEVGAGDQAAGEDAPHYLRIGFRVRAVNAPPDMPHVELARLLRTDIARPVRNAADAEQPGPQELDLRFRRHIGQRTLPPMALGLVALERTLAPQHWQGWFNLARELRQTGAQNIWAQNNVILNQEVRAYPLLCLAGQRGFELSQNERHHLYEYLRGGGVVYYESCRRDLRAGDAPADKAFLDLVAWMQGQVVDVPANHPLYRVPHLFLQPPEGYESRTQAPLQMTGVERGIVIISKHDYGCVWSGSRRERTLTRTELREAFEWGANLVAFALHHRAQFA